jgi:hypothetical protein
MHEKAWLFHQIFLNLIYNTLERLSYQILLKLRLIKLERLSMIKMSNQIYFDVHPNKLDCSSIQNLLLNAH